MLACRLCSPAGRWPNGIIAVGSLNQPTIRTPALGRVADHLTPALAVLAAGALVAIAVVWFAPVGVLEGGPGLDVLGAHDYGNPCPTNVCVSARSNMDRSTP